MAPNEKTSSLQMENGPIKKKKSRKWTCENSDEELVISGISGVYPNSDNMHELYDNLLAKKDLITDDDRRWKQENPKVPHRLGKINEIDKFDAAFFGISEKQAEVIDPMGRILLEKTYEAIIDAGYNPKELKGSKTGVFVGASFSSPEYATMSNKDLLNSHALSGTVHCMFANRISFWLGVHGPSYVIDTACSSSAYALENAYKAIKNGDCDAAIVGGCNLCLHPVVMLLFKELGVLSPDGRCKCFDETGDGYAKSESVVSILIQKKKDARRIYARLVHAKANCDGFKEEGVHFPSEKVQKNLLEEFYEECEVNPKDVQFVEAHATGTKAGDPVELSVIESTFLPGRTEPLKIGSIKSNMGHSEPASGLCSIAKVILSYETGTILPNINLAKLRSDIDGLKNGKLRVITEPTQWSGGLTAVNSFGFGGANCHILLDSNPKEKTRIDVDEQPRLVVTSGRTEEAVDVILSDFEGRPLDVEYVGLLHKIHEEAIPSHYYRGYTLLRKDKASLRSIQEITGENRSVWFVYSGMGSQWPEMGKSLMKIPIFAESIRKCHRILKSVDVNLINNIISNDSTVFENLINSSTAVVAIKIALTDTLAAINIKPDGYVGHSLGEMGCAYADGCLTTEQALLGTYYRAVSLIESSLTEGSMAAIGMSYTELLQKIPSDIDIACQNSAQNCTVSGPKDAVKKFVRSLQQQDVFAKEINSSNIAFHSRYIKEAGKMFLQYLKNINIKSKLRSNKWISSTFAKSERDTNNAKYCGQEYLIANMLNMVHFEEALRHIPDNAMVIEVAPHGLLQAILKRTLSENCINIPLTSRTHSDNSEHFLCAIGRIFQAGANPHIAKLYPSIDFPVSRGTPMISHLVKWDHRREWYVYKHDSVESDKVSGHKITVSLKDDEYEYLLGHVIDGRTIYPAAGYLVLVWKILSSLLGKSYEDVPVVFRNVKFLQMTNIEKDGKINFTVIVRKERNDFEISQNGALVVSGKIDIIKDTNTDSNYLPLLQDSINDPEILSMTMDDVYRELKSKGYHYKGLFRGITNYNFVEKVGRISWINNFVTFIDSMLQTKILMEDVTRPTIVPKSIRKIVINTKNHFEILNAITDSENKELPVYGHKQIDVVQSGGIRIENVELVPIKHKKHYGNHIVDKVEFIPYINPKLENGAQLFNVIATLTSENSNHITLESIELVDNFTNTNGPLFSERLLKSFKKVPLYQLNASILSNDGHPLVSDELKECTKEIKKWPCDKSCFLIIASNVLGRDDVLENCLKSLKQYGFLLAIESSEEIFPFDKLNLNVCFDYVLENKRVLLLRKFPELKSLPAVIKIMKKSYSWLSEVQKAIHKKNGIILLAENDPFTGVFGFIRSLRKESRRGDLRCFLILDDTAPPFSLVHPFYQLQLSKNLSVNIYKNGSWGTYSYLKIENSNCVSTPHAYINAVTPGDLSSLQWIQGPLNPSCYKPSGNKTVVHVYFAPLNFRDVMLATGKLSGDSVTRNQKRSELAVGAEFAGKTVDGKRYMGFVDEKAIANVVECPTGRMWPVPDNWTLEDAATVPVVYATVLYALFMRARMRRGESILIHSGAGGVGLAAINVCLEYGCEIFTTVGSEMKRKFIRSTFPSIPESHIGYSRDESFEQMIKIQTNGRGVDIVLNSLAEEKLLASVRCLAFKGRFLEIGKYDLSQNSPLGMNCFLDEISFHGIDLGSMYSDKRNVKELNNLMDNAIKTGMIKPLIRSVFAGDQVEAAFRIMFSGKHIGKIIIKIRNEESDLNAKPSTMNINALQRYYCSAEKSYIICGGLGGIGLELTEWLISRGAHNIILASRNGVTNGFQARKIQLWQSAGINVVVGKYDIADDEKAKELLKAANSFGPVSAIFNLAAVLIDKVLEQQSEESFAASTAPKVTGTWNLDKLSRVFCPYLEHFVVFSSAIVSVGNAEQTNYGFSNFIAERICENRKAENFPALAIQWGAIADVGILSVFDSDIDIAGVSQQGIDSCMETLDMFLHQPNVVVRSVVIGEKVSSKEKSLLTMIAQILGIKDVQTLNLNSTLGDIGLDSITSLEIRNGLEKTYDIYMQPQEIRDLTIARLHEMNTMERKSIKKQFEKINENELSPTDLGFEYIVAIMNADISFLNNEEPFVRLPCKLDDADMKGVSANQYPKIYIFPGMDGIPHFVSFLSKHLKATVYSAIYYRHQVHHNKVEEYAEEFLTYLLNTVPVDENIYIVGYCFGGSVAVELVRQLEKNGRSSRLWLLDISPEVSAKYHWPKFDVENLEKGINPFETLYPGLGTINNEHRAMINAFFGRIKAANEYLERSHQKCNTLTTLIRVENSGAHKERDYGLSKHFQHPVIVHFVDANHFSILKKKETADIIMNDIDAINKKGHLNKLGIPNTRSC